MRRILLIVGILLFAVGCEDSTETKLEKTQLTLQEKHILYHERNGFDFNVACSMCGNTASVMNQITANKTKRAAQNASTMSTISAVNSMNSRNSCARK